MTPPPPLSTLFPYTTLFRSKRTLLVAHALEAAGPADAAALRAGLGKRELTDAEAQELRAILRRSGAVEAARAEAERLCAEALRSEEHTSELQSPDHLVCRLL